MLHLIKRIIKEEFSILSEDVKLAEKILNSKNIPLDNPNYLDIKNYLLKNNSIGFLGEIVRLSRSVNDFKSTAEFILNNKDLIKSLPKQISSYNSLNELKDDIDNMSNYRLVKKLTNKLTNKSLIKELLNNLPNNSTIDNIDYFLNNIQSTDQKEFLRKTDKYNDIDSFYYDLKDFIENHKIGFYFDNVLNTINKMNKYAIKLLYANKNMILARIIDYSASYELGSKSWCIVGDAETFNNYTKNGENNQYFFFNFNENIPSNLNMIAFTLNDKNEVTASHDRYDSVFNNPIEYLEKLGIKDKVFLINSREMIHKNLSNIDKKLPLDYDEQIIRIRYDIKGEPYEQQQKNYKSVLNNICNHILYLLSSKEVNLKNHLDLFIEKFEQFFVNAYDEKTYKVIKNYKKINMISYLLNNFDNLNSKSISKENFIKIIKKIYLSDIKLNNETKFDLFYFLKNNNVDILKLSQLKKSKENKNLSDTEFSMLSKKGENLKPIIQNKLAAIRNGGNFNMSYPEVIYAIDNGYKNIIEKYYKNLLPFFKKNQLSLDDLNVYKKLNLLNDIAKSIKFKADNYTPDSLNSIEKSLLDIFYKPKKLKEELENKIITCKICGHQWYLKDGGDDPYTCHECNPKTLNEKCWKGYTQKGMKTMFGKQYPNCVKKKKLKEELDEALKDELPDYMINAVKANNPIMAYRYLDMDVPKHTELIPNVKIELNEPDIKNKYIKQIQFSFAESIIKQFLKSKLIEINPTIISVLEKGLSKNMDYLYKSTLQDFHSNLGTNKTNDLINIIKDLSFIYSKNFPLLQGKDNNLKNPIFSNNKSNIFTFIKSFNTAFPQYAIDLNEIMNDRVFQGLREPIINFDENVNDLANSKLYLYITDKPADILRMSVSNFYSSCQNLYSGSQNDKLLANVFDENSKIAYLIFDSPYVDNQGNKHPFSPIARTIIRVGQNNIIMFDQTYPISMENEFYKILEKYTNLKNQGQPRSVYPYKNIGLPAPYMDRYSIKSNFTYDKDEGDIRRELLANYLNTKSDNIQIIGDTHFEYNGDEYLVYTEEEADEYAMDKLRTEWFEYINPDASFYNLINLDVFNIEPIYKLFRINDDSLKKNNLTLQKFLAKLGINTLNDFELYLMKIAPVQDSQNKPQQFQTRLDFKKEFLTREDVFNIDRVVDLFGLIDDVRKATLSADGEEHFVEQGAMIIYKYS